MDYLGPECIENCILERRRWTYVLGLRSSAFQDEIVPGILNCLLWVRNKSERRGESATRDFALGVARDVRRWGGHRREHRESGQARFYVI